MCSYAPLNSQHSEWGSLGTSLCGWGSGLGGGGEPGPWLGAALGLNGSKWGNMAWWKEHGCGHWTLTDLECGSQLCFYCLPLNMIVSLGLGCSVKHGGTQIPTLRSCSESWNDKLGIALAHSSPSVSLIIVATIAISFLCICFLISSKQKESLYRIWFLALIINLNFLAIIIKTVKHVLQTHVPCVLNAFSLNSIYFIGLL